jgi:RimJ/RimL family protein N-acetyltransferase
LYELDRTEFERVRPLFRKMDLHLPLQAILAGNVSAQIFVDNTRQPQIAFTWSGHRFYAAGSPGNVDLIQAARKVFLEYFSVPAWKSGIDSYVIYYPSDKWEGFIKTMLDQKYPIKLLRSYYTHKNTVRIPPAIPEGYVIQAVDAALLARKWQNLEFLTDEMVSERESVEDFLAKSFGICLTRGDQIIGWCLSEYNTGHRCEVGIATEEDYQQRGFATILAANFVEVARSKGFARIGWHSSASNTASGATALKAGFEKVQDYPVFVGWFDDAVNIARNGYFAHGRGEYAEALAFYEKAISLGEVPDWVYWGATCDAALTGESRRAFTYLEKAIDLGFDDLEEIQNSKYLISLHELDGWQEILHKLK